MTRALAACGLIASGRVPADMGAALGSASAALDAFECRAVVLDAAVSAATLSAWLPQLVHGGPSVVAVHAPCPTPETSSSTRSYQVGDVRPASPDASERADALALIRPALSTASAVGSTTVVIEGGPLPLGTGVARLETAAAADTLDDLPARHIAAAVQEQRAAAGAAAVDGWCFAVEALLPAIEERGLVLALAEQRGLAWAGSLGEVAQVLDRFAGAPLTWWADRAGRMQRNRLLPGWVETGAPTAPPQAVWWRVPQTAEGWRQRLGLPEEGEAEPPPAFDAEALQVLVPQGGTLTAWHHYVWSVLGS